MIFEKSCIRNMEVKNKIVMPPMVAFGKAGQGGMVSNANITHYELRAQNNVGLIITEAMYIDEGGRLSLDQLGIDNDNKIDGLKNLTEAIYKHGAKVIAQIHHAGLNSIADDKISASDYDMVDRGGKLLAQARGMSIDEIISIEKKYIEAAIRAEKAGYDGVELHGAHGYLLCQFFSTDVNKRTDSYGGSIEKRASIAVNIIKGIRVATGKDFIIGMRMGSCEPTLTEGIGLAQIFEKNGIDYLNISTGFSSKEQFVLPDDFPCNQIVYGAVKIKEQVNVPVMAVNQINTVAKARYLIDYNLVDFICIGRGVLADPTWALKAEAEEKINICAGCKPCGWFKNDACVKNKEKK